MKISSTKMLTIVINRETNLVLGRLKAKDEDEATVRDEH
jgi:hypothetical protein